MATLGNKSDLCAWEVVVRRFPYAGGVVPVAIFGSPDFDVAEIDPATLHFGPAGAAYAHNLTDPWTFDEHVEDLDLDGFVDLITHYQTQETGIACGDTEVTLSGQTLSGQFIEGSDSIRTVDCTSSRPFGRRQPQRIELVDRERPAEPVKQQKVE